MSRHHLHPLLWASLLVFSSCGTPPKSSKTATPPEGASRAAAVDVAPDAGLVFELAEAEPSEPRQDSVRVAETEPLSSREAESLLSRLPALQLAEDDEKEFSIRPQSPPPPRAGKTERASFPPKEDGEAAPEVSGPLAVVRFSPEGEVPIAPHVSVTFDRPMVAITSHDDAVAKGVPVRIEPTPPGRFRWLGARTLLFEPEGARLPMATRFRVTIPAGTSSASGGTLARDVVFDFTTPAPTLVGHHPQDGVQPLEPLVFLQFDQKVDPAAVAPRVSFVSRLRLGARLATPEEIEADPTVRRLVAEAEHPDRVVVLRPVEPLPRGASVRVEIAAGTPSLEGPGVTKEVQGFSLQTYGRFQVTEHRCGWNGCRPGDALRVLLSNPIDATSLAGVRVSPEIPRMKVRVEHQWLVVEGETRGRTRHAVTLPSELRDVFGQTLEEEVTVTFDVGDAEPSFHARGGVVIADPSKSPPSYTISTVNVPSIDVEVYAVTPADFSRFVALTRETHRAPVTPPGRRVKKETVAVDGAPDAMVQTEIDLSAALVDGVGHAVVVAKPSRWRDEYVPRAVAWVQVTKIALDAFVDGEEMLAWTTQLSDGKPLEGVSLHLEPGGREVKTDRGGLATLPLPATRGGEGAMLVARRGADVAFLPYSSTYFSEYGGWTKDTERRRWVWHVFDDRHIYRPGETVRVKGWVRVVDFGRKGDVEPFDASAREVTWTLFDPLGSEIGKGRTKLSALGGFDTTLKIPETPNLGYAHLELKLSESRGVAADTHHHTFQIQEFRRPEFEVTTRAARGDVRVGEKVDVTAEATYYAGGPLADAPVSWRVTSSETQYTPPNRGDFRFGRFVPWWRGFGTIATTTTEKSLSARTDASGKHALSLELVAADPPLPSSVVAEASVSDVNRQAWSSRATLLVHPSDLYVGLKSDRYFVDKGKPIEVDVIVVGHDGGAVLGRAAEVTVTRVDARYENGTYVETEEDPRRCAIESRTEAVRCRFETKVGGMHKVRAIVRDDRGRPNLTEITVWVSGAPLPPAQNVEHEKVTLIPDRDRYAPGEKAKLLVQAPFFPAEGLLTTRRGGIVSTERFALEGPTTTLEIPIEEGHVPNLVVQVDLVGSVPRVGNDGRPLPGDLRRPAYAVGTLDLPVPPETRKLTVTASPERPKLAPGEESALTVEVRDADGRPVRGAEVAVIVVDEAVLALSSAETPDPLAVFYPPRHAGTSDHYGRAMVLLALEPTLGRLESKTMGSGRGASLGAARMEMAAAPPAPSPSLVASPAAAQAGAPIALRTHFDALAFFEPEAKTDAAGKVKVRVKVPDNLTRYRVMAVAVAGAKQFGSGESSLVARLPLMVRPSAPRFLNFGDVFELPFVVQNQTDEPLEVMLAARASNLSLTEGAGRRLKVPANDRVEVRLPAKAEKAGTARFQVAVSAGRYSDAAEGSLPVYTPATTEAFATYGELDEGATLQPVAMPGGVITGFGGLEVSTSSTQLQALTDAVLYLAAYPFECAEQVSSRVLAIAALRDVLEAFEAEGMPTRAELEKAVRRDLERLTRLQNTDGGFSFWERGRESWPWVSIHVTHALVRAKQKGFAVPEDTLRRALSYVATVERRIPDFYPPSARDVIEAYALAVRAKAGDRDVAKAKALLSRVGTQRGGTEALGFLLGVLSGEKREADAILRTLQNRLDETAAAATFATSYEDGAYLILASSRRADAVVLESLIAAAPKSDLVAKLVRGLLAHRVKGRWGNTQENTFVLLALDAYFQAFEKVTPNFVANIWLGEGLASERVFRGRETTTELLEVPMRWVAEHPSDVTIAKTGPGRLYYRIGMRYAPASLRLEAADHGFAVERTYEAVDDPSDVVREKDGTWTVRAGARVRVRVTMVAESRRTHVALVDPLPAGFEALNPSLAVTGAIPSDPKAKPNATPWWFWLRPWFEHQNLRDERAEAFTTYLYAGVHEYTYVARATTPGTFVVPPAKAEEMYAPETFGRSASDRVVVRAAP